jgi:hypothetical protein
MNWLKSDSETPGEQAKAELIRLNRGLDKAYVYSDPSPMLGAVAFPENLVWKFVIPTICRVGPELPSQPHPP